MMVVGKKTKSLIVVFVWIIAVLAFAFSLLQIFNPSKRLVDETIYSSDISSTIDYNIRLTNTPVYNKAKDAEPSKYYIVPFTDYIQLDCSYLLNGSDNASITSNSYITVFLVSYIDEGSDEVILWKKEYTLADLETNETTGTNIEGTKSIKLRLEEYTSLVDQIFDTYSFKSSYYLMVLYTTEFNVSYGDHNETTILQPYLRINLENLLFEVIEKNVSSDKIEIEQQITIDDEVDWEMVIIGGTVFLLLAILAMLLPTKLLTTIALSKEAKEIKQINIKYGARIVNVAEKPRISQTSVKVESIEDIMKITDEIGQPIFSVKVDDEIYYYVINHDVMYYIVQKNN